MMPMTMFMVLSSWPGHCENSPGSFGECRLMAKPSQPPTNLTAGNAVNNVSFRKSCLSYRVESTR